MAKKMRKKQPAQAIGLAGELMLAPMVASMRLPKMALEAQNLHFWPAESIGAVTEKAAAMAEGAMAAQMSLAMSASRFWLDVMSGKSPQLSAGFALAKATEAALAPAGKRVQANFHRLNRGSS